MQDKIQQGKRESYELEIKKGMVSFEKLLIDDREYFNREKEQYTIYYKLKGKAWKKTESHIKRTINNLDYENLYFNVRNKYQASIN